MFFAPLTLLAAIVVVDAAVELPEDLATKLDYHFSIWDQGQDFLIDRVVNQNSPVSRTEWDVYLTPEDSDMILTESDVEVLKAFHSELEEEARSRADSSIDIESFRNDDDRVSEFCATFPRNAVLHIHPGGTVDAVTAREALETVNPSLNMSVMMAIGTGNDPSKIGLTELYDSEIEFMSGMESKNYMDYSDTEKDFLVSMVHLPEEPCCHGFKRFESMFSILSHYFKQTSEGRAIYEDLTFRDFIRRNSGYGIEYAELTKTVIPPTYAKMERYDNFVTDQMAKNGGKFMLNYNVAYVRSMPNEVNGQNAQTMIAALKNVTSADLPHTVGIDLLGEETDFTALAHQVIYSPVVHARNKGEIPILGGLDMHAGELPKGLLGAINVRDAIIMGVTRIGHSAQTYRDPVILEYHRRKKVPVVANIVSNWRLRVIEDDDIRNHPFLRYIRLGIPVTLSTDDEGMFLTDIANECKAAIQNFDIQYSELKHTSYTAITASFANDAIKTRLTNELDAKFESFEASYADTTMTTAGAASKKTASSKKTKKKSVAKKATKKVSKKGTKKKKSSKKTKKAKTHSNKHSKKGY